MRSHARKFGWAAIAALGLGIAGSSARGALVTFSAMNNGVNTATDPESNSTGNVLPSNYQPLMNAYPAPGGNTDGANIGVTITWSNVFGANTATNSAVNDHTHQVTPTDTAQENAYDNGATTMTITFSSPVTLPNFYWAYYSGSGSATPSFAGYTNSTDATPAVSFTGTYPAAGGGYLWQQATGFGTTPVEKVTFSRGAGNYLQIDDLTINAAPEPATIGLLAVGAGLWLVRRRRTAR